MTTADYRDEISSLSYSISSFESCVNFEERSVAAERLGRAWRRLALMEQPKRLAQSDADRCTRILAKASNLLNEWKIDVDAGVAHDCGQTIAFPEKAMRDTMRFCESMKRR